MQCQVMQNMWDWFKLQTKCIILCSVLSRHKETGDSRCCQWHHGDKTKTIFILVSLCQQITVERREKIKECRKCRSQGRAALINCTICTISAQSCQLKYQQMQDWPGQAAWLKTDRQTILPHSKYTPCVKECAGGKREYNRGYYMNVMLLW